ncbi:hypothetical protein GA0115259_105885 [Streptomyces sp. MnatMP-M17]|nr:hypothetical protein GA0115259_105885 [Streptomyces sp. MnatMP-M17]
MSRLSCLPFPFSSPCLPCVSEQTAQKQTVPSQTVLKQTVLKQICERRSPR